MILSLKFISSKSGKSMVLQVQEKTYLFNMFEGFQRYAIEERFSLVSIDTLFLTSKACIPGLMGTYLTLSESQKDRMVVVSNFDPEFFSVYKFHVSKTLQLSFTSGYDDKYISVRMFDLENTTNFIVSLPKVDGSVRANEIPEAIPRRMYREFMSTGTVTVDGTVYNLSSYKDEDIQLNTIALIFSEISDEAGLSALDLLTDVSCIFCFTDSSWKYFLRNRSPASGPKSNFEGVFYVADNNFVEFGDFYERQLRLSRANSCFLLPRSGPMKPPVLSDDIIQPGDKLNYAKRSGIYFDRKENTVPETVNYVACYPSIEFLGTGCAIPSKERNVSAILYQNEDSAVLMDCGEDTLTQIQRLHGSLDVLNKLKIVYISHNHADHLLGIAGVLRSVENPVLLIAPGYVREYLAYFGIHVTQLDIEDPVTLVGHVNFIETDPLKDKEASFYRDGSPEDMDISRYVQEVKFGGFEIVMCGCRHSKSSVSVAITDTHSGKKFSYSGDTEPSLLFSRIASGSDVMIHEATFEEALVDEARRRMHSTAGEANRVFEDSKSRALLLTHFSNRSEVGEDDGRCVRDFYRFKFS